MDSKTKARNSDDLMEFSAYHVGKGYFAERGKLSTGNLRKIQCGFLFCGMKGKVRNKSMRNVTEMNIC